MSGLYFRLSLMRDAPVLRAKAQDFFGLALEAHIVELYSNAVGTFLASIAKPYFVDPVFYKFSSSFFEELSEKRWVDLLTAEYGIEGLMSSNPEGFEVLDLGQLKAVDQVVGQILDYQRRRILSLTQRSTALASLIGETPPAVGPPAFLVSPYVIAIDRLSIGTNVKIAIAAVKKKKPEEKLFAVIAVSRDFLSSSKDLQAIINSFSSIPADGYLVWICDFKDWQEDSEILKTFANFVHDLSVSSGNKEVINLFGGYFSTVLTARQLLGASVQGVGMAEFRDPFVTGGGFAKRYYVPISHQFVSVDLADDLRDADSSTFGCSCTQCGSGATPGTMSVQALAQHFVETRTQEFHRASAMSALAIADMLKRDAAALMRVKMSGVAGLASAHGRRLEVWEWTLRDLVKSHVVA